MIKLGITHPTGRRLVALGLTGENITRLVAGEPLLVHLEEMGIEGVSLAIDYGKATGDVIDSWERQGLLDEQAAARARALPEAGGRVDGVYGG